MYVVRQASRRGTKFFVKPCVNVDLVQVLSGRADTWSIDQTWSFVVLGLCSRRIGDSIVDRQHWRLVGLRSCLLYQATMEILAVCENLGTPMENSTRVLGTVPALPVS